MSLLYKQNLHLILYLENKYVRFSSLPLDNMLIFVSKSLEPLHTHQKKNIYIYIMIIHNLKEL